MEKDLKRLVELAKTGDQQAIAQLYEQTSCRAYYLAKQLVKDEDQAQDIVQDACEGIYQPAPAGTGGEFPGMAEYHCGEPGQGLSEKEEAHALLPDGFRGGRGKRAGF